MVDSDSDGCPPLVHSSGSESECVLQHELIPSEMMLSASMPTARNSEMPILKFLHARQAATDCLATAQVATFSRRDTDRKDSELSASMPTARDSEMPIF